MKYYCQNCWEKVEVNFRPNNQFEVVPCKCSFEQPPTVTNQEVVEELKQMAKEKLEEIDVDRLAGGYAMGLTHAAWVLSNKE